MKRFIQGVTLVFVFTVWSSVSYACFCAKPEVSDAFNRARAVFIGQVLQVIPPPTGVPKGEFVKDLHTIQFRVEREWKGAIWPEIEVLARWDGCLGLKEAPRKGARFLVYADPVYPRDESRREIMISGCTRTVPVPFPYLEADPDGLAGDIRALNSIMFFNPRPRRTSLPWMTFLDADK